MEALASARDEFSERIAIPSNRRRNPRISSVGDKELIFKPRRVEAEVVARLVPAHRADALMAKDEPGSNSREW